MEHIHVCVDEEYILPSFKAKNHARRGMLYDDDHSGAFAAGDKSSYSNTLIVFSVILFIVFIFIHIVYGK